MDIQHGDRAAIRNIRFDNIRVEIDAWNPPPRMQRTRDEQYKSSPADRYCPTLLEIVIRKNNYSKDDRRGTVRDVIYKDIAVTGPRIAPSRFRGFDVEHTVENVTISNLRFNGKPVSNAEEAGLHIGQHVGRVQFTDRSPPRSETR
jgi:hypothetical protein